MITFNQQQAKTASEEGSVNDIPKGFHILDNDSGVARIMLKGPFLPPILISEFLSQLHVISEKCPVAEVHINSEGGDLNVTVEILECLKRFDTVVTIAYGQASSAGAMVWSSGHIRVISPYSSIMYHRESYGFYGKTAQHAEVASHNESLYAEFLEECAGDILSESQIIEATKTEVFIGGKELIESGKAISLSQYREREDGQLTTTLGFIMLDENNRQWVVNDGIATCPESGDQFMMMDIMLNVPNPRQVNVGNEETLEEELSPEELTEMIEQYRAIADEMETSLDEASANKKPKKGGSGRKSGRAKKSSRSES